MKPLLSKPESFKRLIRNLRLKEEREQMGVCDWCGYKVENPCKTAAHRAQCELS